VTRKKAHLTAATWIAAYFL